METCWHRNATSASGSLEWPPRETQRSAPSRPKSCPSPRPAVSPTWRAPCRASSRRAATTSGCSCRCMRRSGATSSMPRGSRGCRACRSSPAATSTASTSGAHACPAHHAPRFFDKHLPGGVRRAVRAAQAVHRRPGRAPPLPGAHARGARVLPAHEFPAAPGALARLARGTRAVVAAFDLQTRPGVRRHQVGADHPQHRLPGRVRRGRRGRSRSRHRRLSTPPGRPQGRDNQRAQAGHPARRLRDHGQPDVRARNHHAALRHGDGAGAGGARQRRARHPERRRLRGMGSAPRPLPADSFHAAGNRQKGRAQAQFPAAPEPAGPSTGACRCSAS